MGNSSSNSVYVALDHNHIYPGEAVSGRAVVNVTTPVKLEGLFLIVKGREKLRWTENKTRTVRVGNNRFETQTYTVHYNGGCVIFRCEHLLLPASGTIFSGQYIVPFTVMMPKNIPGSMSIEHLRYSASITYKAKLRGRVPGLLKSDLRADSEIMIVQTPPAWINSVQASRSSCVKQFCCFNKGDLEIKLYAAKDAFVAGEDATATAIVSNKSSARIPKVSIKIRRHIELRAYRGTVLRQNYTVACTIDKGIEAHAANLQYNMSIRVPPNSIPHCVGSTIRCIYTLDVVAKVKWGADITCAVPIIIFGLKPTQVVALPAPPVDGWNPVLATPVDFTMPTPSVPPVELSYKDYPNCEANVLTSAGCEAKFLTEANVFDCEANVFDCEANVFDCEANVLSS